MFFGSSTGFVSSIQLYLLFTCFLWFWVLPLHFLANLSNRLYIFPLFLQKHSLRKPRLDWLHLDIPFIMHIYTVFSFAKCFLRNDFEISVNFSGLQGTNGATYLLSLWLVGLVVSISHLGIRKGVVISKHPQPFR